MGVKFIPSFDATFHIYFDDIDPLVIEHYNKTPNQIEKIITALANRYPSNVGMGIQMTESDESRKAPNLIFKSVRGNDATVDEQGC